MVLLGSHLSLWYYGKMFSKNLFLNTLHVLNDGLKVSLLLFLPFIAKDLHLPFTQVGLLGSSVNLVAILISLPGAYLAMKIGGMKLLLFAMLTYAVAFLTTSFTNTYLIIAGSFLLAGVGFGVFHPVAFALVTKSAPPEKRGKVVGDFTALGDIGTIALPAVLTFVIAFFGWHMTSFIYGIAILVLFGILYQLRPEKNPTAQLPTLEEEISVPLRRNKRFFLALAISATDAFISGPMFVFLPFLLLHNGINTTFLGAVTGVFFAGSLTGKSFLGRLVDKYGNIRVFIFAELTMAIFLIIIAHVTFTPIMLITGFLLGIVTRGTSPAIKSMVFESIGDPKKAEKAFGLEELVVGIGITLGPAILGFLSDHVGIVNAFSIGALFAVIATIPAIFLALHIRHGKELL